MVDLRSLMGPKAGGEGASGGASTSVQFDGCKGEVYSPANGFRGLTRRLKGSYGVLPVNKDEITAAKLCEASINVFAAPREMFSMAELKALKTYVDGGGSVLITGHEGGEGAMKTNVNYLLEQYGLSINSDAVVRTVYYKYAHPKEVLITDGILNREVKNQVKKLDTRDAAAKAFRLPENKNSKWGKIGGAKAVLEKGDEAGPRAVPKGPSITEDEFSAQLGQQIDESTSEGTGLDYVYVQGATVGVQKPAVSVMSSGNIAYPMNRPTVAVHHVGGQGGRICVVGSTEMFEDRWIEKEENGKLAEFIFRWLDPQGGVKLYELDAEDPDVGESHAIPDTEALAERLRSCLQEGEELPRNFQKLFDAELFQEDFKLVPEVIELYEKLGVPHKPLTLIPPQFEVPMPSLKLATFPPILPEPDPPALELFDLDEEFAGPASKLATLANKCNGGAEEDISFFCTEGAEIVGLSEDEGAKVARKGAKVPERVVRDPKKVLEKMFQEICNWKKLSFSEAMPLRDPGFGYTGEHDIPPPFGLSTGGGADAAGMPLDMGIHAISEDADTVSFD